MRSVLLLAFKDLRLLFRDKGGVFWTFGFPLIFAALFGAMFSGIGSSNSRSKIAVAVVDEAQSEASQAFVGQLRARESITIELMTRNRAADAVRLRDKTAYLVLAMQGEPGDPTSATRLKYTIGIDPSRQAEAGMLRGILMEATIAGLLPMNPAGGDVVPEIPGGGAIEVVDVARSQRTIDRITSGYQIAFPAAILWGIMGCVAGFAISFVRERTRGTHLRLLISPLSPFAIVAGKSLSCLISALLVAIFLLGLASFAFRVHIDSVSLLALAVFSTAFCFTGLMMLLGSLAKTEEAVNGAGWGVMTILAMIGGGMMPLAFFPDWLVPFSHASPVKWGIFALEGAIWRGFDSLDMLLPIGILLGVGGLGFALAMLALRNDRAA